MDADIAQPHPTKKCVVLCVAGLLCYINPNVRPDRWNPHRNVVKRPGLKKLFGMLFERFHVGLWSRMQSRDLIPLLNFLLPGDVISKISFIFGREYCEQREYYPWCYKVLRVLYSKRLSRPVRKPDQVLLVDVNPISLRKVPDSACYIPLPFQGSSCRSGVISNAATDLLPFIYPMHMFESVSEYIRCSPRPGQLHYEVAHAIRYGRR
jgi:hypothetical protein